MALSREEWREERRNHIGASEVWKILSGRALEVYEAKVTGHSESDEKWLKYGREMENPIANMYADETGRIVDDLGATEFQYHPDIPWLAATLDRRVRVKLSALTRPGALEVKNTDIPGFKPETWSADNPDLLFAIVQNQVQMACTEWSWGSIVGKFPYYKIAWFDQERNDDFLETVYPELESFWRCVVDKTPPPIESHRDLEVVKRLFPKDDGEVVALGDEALMLADALGLAKDKRKNWDNDVKELEAKLRAAIGDATYGALPDGTFLALKTTKCKGYTTVVEPYEYRSLRRVKKK
jgi:predicted phage-related endonuclease